VWARTVCRAQAARGKTYECTVDPEVVLPMIFVDDLLRGLVALQMAPEAQLLEPQRGYNLPGLSFAAKDLFHEIRVHVPAFATAPALNPNMDKFSRLWPDTLCGKATLRDLKYSPRVKLPKMVANVLIAHHARMLQSKAAFRSIDHCESGRITPATLAKYVRAHVAGREGYSARRVDQVGACVAKLMAEMDPEARGTVCLQDFMKWNWNNDIEGKVDTFMTTQLSSLSAP